MILYKKYKYNIAPVHLFEINTLVDQTILVGSLWAIGKFFFSSYMISMKSTVFLSVFLSVINLSLEQAQSCQSRQFFIIHWSFQYTVLYL